MFPWRLEKPCGEVFLARTSQRLSYAGLIIEVDDFEEAQAAGRLKIDLGNLRTIGRARNSKDLCSKDHLSRKKLTRCHLIEALSLALRHRSWVLPCCRHVIGPNLTLILTQSLEDDAGRTALVPQPNTL